MVIEMNALVIDNIKIQLNHINYKSDYWNGEMSIDGQW